MQFSLAQESRKGGRPYNQDRVGHWQTSQTLLMAVADGMGGYAGGERAAQLALDTLKRAFKAGAKPRLLDPQSFLSRGVAAIHDAILEDLGDGPRTTVVACVVQAGHAWWAHVGDSRLYLIRRGRILARTRDHSVVQGLIDAGRMREEALPVHPERNKLLRCLGGARPQTAIPIGNAPLLHDDLLLLCTDGAWAPLAPVRLLMEVVGKKPARALPDLMALAEQRAGEDSDNLSGIALRWEVVEAAGIEPASVNHPQSGLHA